MSDKLRALLQEVRGLLFDFDGLLVDSEPYYYRSYREVFARYGHDLKEEEYWDYWTYQGLGTQGEIERYGLDLDPLQIRNERIPIYSRYCREGHVKWLPGAVALIQALHARGYKLAVASGSQRQDLEVVIAQGGVTDCFSAVLGSQDAPTRKPEPEIFLNAAAALELEPAQCLVMEDAAKGVIAAERGGIPAVMVLNDLNRGLPIPDHAVVVESLDAFAAVLPED